jgi:stress response protein YsnF
LGEPNDGERKLSLAAQSEQSPTDLTDNPKLTLLAEELEVRKEAVETGRLRVSKQTHTREALIDESLVSEQAEVETIPVGRQIFEMPSVREEGDSIIVPIVEEVLHTERRFKITRRRKTEQFQDRVTLRYQEAVITRVQSATEPADAASAKEMKSSDSRE